MIAPDMSPLRPVPLSLSQSFFLLPEPSDQPVLLLATRASVQELSVGQSEGEGGGAEA